MTDASTITYTAPFTGAVQRTLASKLAETISVTDFGAVQDGNPVATQAAFVAAITAIKDYANIRHHRLFIPAGRWNLNDTLNIGSNITIYGAGKAATRLIFPSLGKHLVKITPQSANFAIRDLMIDNGAPVASSIALAMQDAYNGTVENLIINNADIGVWLYGSASYGAYYCKLSDVTVSGNNRVGFMVDSAVAGSNVNEHSFYGCQSHGAVHPWLIYSGNNNRIYSPTAETNSAPGIFYSIGGNVEDLVIIAPRAETGGSAGGIGVNIASGAKRVIVMGGNFQNVAQRAVNAGTDTTLIFGGGYTPPTAPPPPPPSGAHRYWGVVKTNAAGAGAYHTELEVYAGATKVNVTYPMMYSQSGLGGVDWSKLIDGNTTTAGFHTDSAAAGAFYRLDFGAGNEQALTKWRWHVTGAVNATWDVVYSDNGTTWTVAASGLNCSGGAGWKEITWTN